MFIYFESVRVSNELGSGHPRAAKYSVFVTCIEVLCLGILFAFLILFTKDHFAVIFTESKEMQEAVSRLAFLLGITMIINSVHPVILGKPNWNILSYCKCKTTMLISSKVIIYVSITFSIGHLLVDP